MFAAESGDIFGKWVALFSMRVGGELMLLLREEIFFECRMYRMF